MVTADSSSNEQICVLSPHACTHTGRMWESECWTGTKSHLGSLFLRSFFGLFVLFFLQCYRLYCLFSNDQKARILLPDFLIYSAGIYMDNHSWNGRHRRRNRETKNHLQGMYNDGHHLLISSQRGHRTHVNTPDCSCKQLLGRQFDTTTTNNNGYNREIEIEIEIFVFHRFILSLFTNPWH